jgi:hypothetical protein
MGRFRLLERIGSGGMGTVYRAFDERLQRQVAVKEVHAEPDRVLREAHAAARLNHPAVVTLYELGERAGRAVLVSELVPGATLGELRSDGVLSDRDVAEIGVDVCAALEHAHVRGVVHRDIKPQNVIVRDDEAGGRLAKLMDFGIARVAGAPTLTAAGEVVGTLAYMSPEQAEGAPAGPPSDVYSLALSLYECWSGANPVAGDTPAQTVRRIGGSIRPLRELRPDLPEGVSDTIDACLDPDPEARPSPGELGECLEAEIDALDAFAPLPGTEAAGADARRTRLGAVRLLALVGIGVALALLAGPLGGSGLALTLAALLAPAALLGLTAASFAPLAAPFLAQLGLGGAGAALGSAAAGVRARALLGAASWAWVLCASLALGAGPDLGIADRAPDGWASDASTAASDVLAPLANPASLAGALIFALAAIALGWVLRLRHGSVALLAAMLWAAAVDAALTLVGNGALGGHPAGVVAAAAAAVALEFGLRRPQAGAGHERGGRQPLRRRLSGRLA